MIKDYFKIALESIRHRGLRTWLTLVGIFIGIAAVVAIISIGQGLQGAIEAEFKDLGTDKIMITPAGSFAGTGGATALTTNDVDTVKKVNGVAEASYLLTDIAQFEWGKDEIYFPTILGVPVDNSYPMMEKVLQLKVEQGRTFKKGDVKKAIVGYDYAHSVSFKDKLKLGQKIIIKGEEFEIIGIKEKIGNEQDDRQIVLPEEGFNQIYISDDEVDMIVVRVKEGILASDVVAPLEKELRRERNVKEGQEDFQIQTFEELIKSFLNIFAIVQGVLVGIAAISLLVGAIGIMNTMYTSVLERTRDIGVMKAIGARNSDILKMFLIEAGLIGFVGGVVGVILGLGIAKIAEIVGGAALGTNLLQAAMPAWLIIGALLFAFILGSVSGALPAIQASKMSPVDALREE
ncbi:MAG: ABC transporter permease [Candidatus Woesearchaeota archaeon]|jgi:putative ABC transport system permease protein